MTRTSPQPASGPLPGPAPPGSLGRVAAIAGYTLVEAARNRLLWLAIAFLASGFVLAEFLAAVAITDTVEFQRGFLGAVLRACAVFLVSLFVITSIVRELNDGVLELVLSRPIPRSSYYFGKLAGFCALGCIMAGLYAAALLVYAAPLAVLAWGITLACELTLVTALSLLCLFTFTQVTAALSAVLAFYVLARSIAAFQLIAESPLLHSRALGQQALHWFVDALAFVLPDLHRFASSRWLIYGEVEWSAVWAVVAQTAIYLVLLSGAALFDLHRRNF